jgi:putative tricarboxylic transport membrane protein
MVGIKMKSWGERIEVIVIVFIGLIIVAEGLRLTLFKASNVLYDDVGPGGYLLFLGTVMLAMGVWHLWTSAGTKMDVKKLELADSGEMPVIMTIAVIALYILLINIFGYLLATAIFFFLEFRILGVRSWSFTFLLTVMLSILYYVVFVRFCNVVFPNGIIPFF